MFCEEMPFMTANGDMKILRLICPWEHSPKKSSTHSQRIPKPKAASYSLHSSARFIMSPNDTCESDVITVCKRPRIITPDTKYPDVSSTHTDMKTSETSQTPQRRQSFDWHVWI